MEWMLMPLKRYADFSGRSRRKEYWLFVLLLIIVNLIANFIDTATGMAGWLGPYGPLAALIGVATLIPSIAVGVRRLHDTNRSGWWMLIGVVPYALMIGLFLSGNLVLAGTMSLVTIVCALGLLVLMLLEGTKGPNNYGPDPKGSNPAEVFS
jgi:uncharacterized membrane protein YhaH (DUF805 family)